MTKVIKLKESDIQRMVKRVLREEKEIDIQSLYKDVENLKVPGSDIPATGRHGDELTSDEKIEKILGDMESLHPPEEEKDYEDAIDDQLTELKNTLSSLEIKLEDNEKKYDDIINNTVEYDERISSLEEKINNLSDLEN